MQLCYGLGRIVFLFINISLAYTQRAIRIETIQNRTCQNDASVMFTSFVLEYFKDKNPIIILQTESDAKGIMNYETDELLSCLMKNGDKPIVNYIITSNQTRDIAMDTIFPREGFKHGYILTPGTLKNVEGQQTLRILNTTSVKSQVIIYHHQKGNTSNATQILQNLWRTHKYLNVITLNYCERHSTYEITIYNPFLQINGEFYKYNITDSNRYTIGSIIKQKMIQRTLNLHHYPLRVCVFDFEGIIKSVHNPMTNTTKYTLMGAELADILFQTLNVTPVYVNPPKGSMFGGKLPNGSFSGTLGLMENGLADISINTHIIRTSGFKRTMYLYPIDSLVFKFIAPKMRRKSRVPFMEIMSFSMLLSIALMYALVLLVRWYLTKLHHKFTRKDVVVMKIDTFRYATSMLATMLLVSQRDPRTDHERCIFCAMLLSSMVIAFSYEGMVVKALSSGRSTGDLHTLEDIADSGLKILISLGFKNHVVHDPTDEETVFERLYKNPEFVTDATESTRRVYQDRDSVFLVNEFVIESYKSRLYNKRTGRDLIHKVPEIFTEVAGAYIALERCPFVSRMNKILMRMFVSGLVLKIKSDARYKLDLAYLKRPQRVGRDGTVFTMTELSFVFKAWSTCMLTCCAIFLAELFVGKTIRRKST